MFRKTLAVVGFIRLGAFSKKENKINENGGKKANASSVLIEDFNKKISVPPIKLELKQS